MNIEIKNRFDESIIISGEYKSVRNALEKNSGTNLEGADLRDADLRGADLRGADLRGADLRGANLEGADLRGADLRGADLWGADLWGADLRGANLWSADLRSADLRSANLDGAFVFICGSRHNLQYNAAIGELQIGCHVFHLEYWILMYDVIGHEEGYSKEQIKEYRNYIRMLKNYL